MPDRSPPFFRADEITTIERLLDYLRDSVVGKVAGLTNEQARQQVVPSGTSLIALVKHLTNVERFWIQYMWVGLDDVALDPDHLTVHASDEVGELADAYRVACVRNKELVGADPVPERLCVRAWKGEHLDLRWVLVHMVEETGRHAGHADILRELIDGATGR